MTSARDKDAQNQDSSSSFTAFGLRAEAKPLAPGLHVVATPIGNLGDITFRALATLAAADAVIAEDTRVSKTLLAHYGVATPLVVVRPQIVTFGSGLAGLKRLAEPALEWLPFRLAKLLCRGLGISMTIAVK